MTIEIEIDSEILEQTKAVFESWDIDLEYAIELFMWLIVEKKKYILLGVHLEDENILANIL